MLIREVSTAELSGAGISHSKSCDGKLDDSLPFLPLTATVGQFTSGPTLAPGEAAIHPIVFEFHENHGRNVQLGEGRRTAKRTASYNQGVVITGKPLPRDQLFQVILTGTGWPVFLGIFYPGSVFLFYLMLHMSAICAFFVSVSYYGMHTNTLTFHLFSGITESNIQDSVFLCENFSICF
jgi:hypothetical protein